MTQPIHSEELCERYWSFDPLAAIRCDDDPPPGVITSGTVFFDIIFVGLPHILEPGEELWSMRLDSCPGGIANLAMALVRLGLRTGPVAGFGDDTYANWIWETLLEQEHVSLTTSLHYDDFHTSLTVTVTVKGDYTMVTHDHELPESLPSHILAAPASRTAVVDLGGETDWWNELRSHGTVLFADIGFDTSGRWDPTDLRPSRHCRASTPSAMEAMAYTRTGSPNPTVRKLAERVPLAVVTDGIGGVYAIDQDMGEEEWRPAVAASVTDTTDAGGMFASGLVLGCLTGWPLEQRLKSASPAVSLAVQQFGDSLAAPGQGDIANWWRYLRHRATGGDLKAAHVSRGYGFLEDLIPRHQVYSARRTEVAFTNHSDLPDKRK